MLDVLTIALDPIMDAPTAMHCVDCGETLSVDRCLNPDCVTAGARASRGGIRKAFRNSPVSGPMFAPRAWTMGGRVD